MTTRRSIALLTLLAAATLQAGCASNAVALRPELSPLAVGKAPPLTADAFRRDKSAAVTEEALRSILAAPVELDETQRLGVLPVTEAYRPERGLPLPAVPAELTRSLDAAGLFQATSEMSTDWPADGDIAGLRELAARYRSGYLLLYRQRFLDDAYANAWAWLYPTLIGAILAPSRTLETAGVLEATLFDVRTGTILFTVYERVSAASTETPWDEDRKMAKLKQGLLEKAAARLAESVVSKVRRLARVASRPES
jgi:hypothetical protein